MKYIFILFCVCFFPVCTQAQFLYDDLDYFTDSLRKNKTSFFLFGKDAAKNDTWFYLMVKENTCTKIYSYEQKGYHYVDSVYRPIIHLRFMDTLSYSLAARLERLNKTGYKALPVQDPKGGHYLVYYNPDSGRKMFYSGNMYTEEHPKSKPYFRRLQRYMIDVRFYLGMKKYQEVYW